MKAVLAIAAIASVAACSSPLMMSEAYAPDMLPAAVQAPTGAPQALQTARNAAAPG